MVSTAATMASGISSSLMSSRTVVPEWKGWPRPVIQLRAGDPTKDVRLEGRAPLTGKAGYAKMTQAKASYSRTLAAVNAWRRDIGDFGLETEPN
jgi:hypothetical protein